MDTTMTEKKATELLIEYGKQQIEDSSKGAISQFCPRCGKLSMRTDLILNALSRHVDVYICPDCGADEALRDASHTEPLPANEWKLFSPGIIAPEKEEV